MTDFVDFCRAQGVLIDAPPPIGVWRRYKTADKPKHRNGAVKFMGDVGFVQNHATQSEVAVWHPDHQYVSKNDQRLLEVRRHEAKKRAESIKAMRAYFASRPPLRGGHTYLTDKGLSMLGCGQLRIDGDLLVIPMYCNDVLMSLQTITPEGEKKYRHGCPVRGNSYDLSRHGAVVTCLVEGFATGLSIFQSLPTAQVIVCFDAGNLAHVARQLDRSGMLVVCADNDYSTAERLGVNPGLQKGREAAEAIGCGLAYPKGIIGSDWADAMLEWGENGPRKMRMAIMREARVAA